MGGLCIRQYRSSIHSLNDHLIVNQYTKLFFFLPLYLRFVLHNAYGFRWRTGFSPIFWPSRRRQHWNGIDSLRRHRKMALIGDGGDIMRNNDRLMSYFHTWMAFGVNVLNWFDWWFTWTEPFDVSDRTPNAVRCTKNGWLIRKNCILKSHMYLTSPRQTLYFVFLFQRDKCDISIWHFQMRQFTCGRRRRRFEANTQHKSAEPITFRWCLFVFGIYRSRSFISCFWKHFARCLRRQDTHTRSRSNGINCCQFSPFKFKM